MIYINLYYTKKDYKNEVYDTSYTEIIDFNIIINKLTKNDVFKLIPSNTVVSFYILKRLRKIFETKGDFKILYVLKNINSDIVSNISHTLDKLNKVYDRDYTLDLTIKNPNSINLKDYKETVNNIHIL